MTTTEEIDVAIRALLMRSYVPLSTREVADQLGIGRDAAYRRLRKLEKRDSAELEPADDELSEGSRVRSELRESDTRIYFFPVTGQVVTGENYTQVKATVAKLAGIARSVGVKVGEPLTAKQKGTLLARYRRELTALRRSSPASARPRIDAWEDRLVRAMAGPGGVLDFGLPFFRAKARYWDIDGTTGLGYASDSTTGFSDGDDPTELSREP